MSLTPVDKSFPKWDVSVTAETSVNPSAGQSDPMSCEHIKWRNPKNTE
jgi:hypothetical protein